MDLREHVREVNDSPGSGSRSARKPGKLPAETVSVSYELEYGIDALEVHADAIRPEAR